MKFLHSYNQEIENKHCTFQHELQNPKKILFSELKNPINSNLSSLGVTNQTTHVSDKDEFLHLLVC